MLTMADYEAWKANQQRAAVGAASVVIGAQEQSPDQLAGDLNLASEFGKVTGNPVPPVLMVGEYRSVFQAAIEKARAETILSSSPRLTEWLRNPENAGVARDDLEGLSWWETGLGATWNATKRGAMRAGPQAYNQYQANVYAERAQDAGRSFGEILRDERTPILNAEGKEVDRGWVGPSDLLGAGYRYAASRLTNLWGQTAEQNAAQYQARAGQIANRIAQIPMSPGGEAGKARFMEAAKAEGWQAQLSAIGKAFTEAPGEMTSFLLQTAAESLPSMAAAAGVGVATRSPGAAAAAMGGTSFAAEYGSAPVEFFKEKGIDVSTPEGAMSVIRNPEIMREAEQRGITRGVIIGALDGLSGGIAGAKLAESALGNMVLQSITQAVLGAGGEAGAQVAAGQNFNLAEVVLEGLAEFATAPVEVGGMAVSRVREVQAKARDAEARVGLFQELSGQAVASKLRARMPDRFRQFIEQATANGPVENVFVPAQEFVTYFQSVGVDPYELLGELDGVSRDDLDAALAGGGDLRIPTATYAAKIAGSEHDAFLMQNMRFDPMDMTAREAAEFNARVDEVMAEMWAEAEDVRLEDEKWRAVEAKIYDDMVSRLRMAGRSTEVATTEAMIYPAFYRVMAERSGLSTEEFLERYPLPQVQGAVPQGMQFKNVDDLNRTLAELRSRVKPTTKQTPLLDFIAKRGGIDDVGGELNARNADGQLRPGIGRLARRLTEDGKPMPLTDAEMKSGVRFGWDYTAQAAVEAGFMADNPVVIEWKDAMAKGDRVAPDLIPVLLEEIDRELAGQGGTVDENTAALDEMEEYLSRLGVSLDDSDEAIRAVLEAAQAEDARMYGQDGQITTESDAFKAWFGASKVVNDDGSPRVVYHGTAADFEAFSRSAVGQGDSGFLGAGFYFGDNKAIARSYSQMRPGNSERVIEAYLSLQNPFMWGPKGLGVRGFVQEGDMLPAEIHDEVVKRSGISGRVPREEFEFAEKTVARVVREVLEGLGYDGVIATDDFSDQPIEFVAFAPTQIKSVFNRGTFDPADPRILYQRGGALDGLLASVRENMARKASLSADLAAAGRPVMFSTADGRRAMAGPDMSKPGGFRLTYLGADGQPSGHSEFATLAEAIRRALDEGMEPSVAYQQAQDQDQPLYVVHNLSAEKLRHAADLGGLAAPSIAVARGDIGFNSFGEISLIGDPSMADPKKKGVRLFNADVYSPRQPRARYKVDKNADAALNATLRPVAERLGLPFDDIGAYDIERDGLSAVNGQMVAKAAWLESIGETVPVVREVPEEPAPVNGMGMIKGTDPDALVTDPAFLARVQRKYKLALSRYDGNADMIAKINAAWLDEAGNISAKMIRNWADQVAKANRAIEVFRAGTQPEGPVSRYLTGKAIDDAVGGRIGDFNGWVREKFGGLITDMFFETEAGLKKEYTLSNLVREMTRAIRNGENWNYGAGNVRAAVAPEFKALAEVKAARGQIIDEKGMEALKTEVNNKLFALADKFAPFAGSEGKGFGWGDNFSEFLRDVAKGPRAVAEWPWAANVPDDLMAEAVAFLESLKSLPTNYFEIKMQRAVDLSEFTAALVPSDLAADARKILTDAGVELVEYQKGDDGEGRNAALQQIGQRVFFQRAEGPRGQISVTADGKSTIRLFESANLSTMLHESGHFFLLVMQDLAAKGEANAAAEYEAVKGWWRENAKAVAADGNRAAGAMPGAYNQGGRTDTASDAFKRWFGDSKVVDADGKPLVVYHGTNADFEAFDPARLGSATSAKSATMGFFFASDPEVASSYADTFNAYKDTKIGRVLTRLFGDKYAAANEALLRFFKRPSAIVSGGNVMPVYLSIKNPMVFDFKGGEYRERTYADLIEEAKEKGHDGVVLRNTIDGGFNEGGDAVTDVYVAFAPTQIKSVFNRGTFDPNDPRILYQDGTDLSLTGEKITITAEDVIRALDTGTTGDSVKDMLVDVGMQEQWARAFEAYLMEGKAPSVELRSAFEKFRAWLISVYRRIAGLNVQISDDIRAVFDRMLASDAEIEKAKRTSGDTGNMFASAEEMGLTAEEYDRFLKLRAQAEDDAKARLMGEIMDPIKREQDKAYRAEKEKVRAEVERNINTSPVYRAWEWMGNRRWLGDGQPANLPDMRLSKSVLVQRYGEGVLKTLPRGKQTIYAVDGGLDPDDAAGWFGFDSGDQMIRALERAPGRKEAITAETDRVMNERHNDPLTDGEIERRALDAVHNDKRGQWIAAELKAVAEVAGVDLKLTAKDARASARQTIARMTVRDAMAAQRFLAAERKAAEEAARLGAMLARESVWANAARRRISLKAKGALVGGSIDAVARQIEAANNSTLNRNETVQKLIAAKRRQLMNHALYMEARAVADEIGKAERFVRNLNKASTREKIAGAGRRENAQTDYLAALDEILDRYDFRKMSGRAEDRRGALLAYVEKMTAAGRANELAIPARVLAEAKMKPYKTLSVEELRGVVDSLKNLQHTALRWDDFLSEQREKAFTEAKEAVVQAITDNVGVKPAQWVKDTGWLATAGEWVGGYIASIRHANSILRGLDGGADLGPTYRVLKADLDAAAYEERRMLKEATAKLEELYSAYTPDEQRQMAVKRYYPELGGSFSKWNLIVMGLNMGNAGNISRLTNKDARMKLTPAQMEFVKSRLLDARDAQFINGVWKYFETFRPLVAARDRRVKGVEPKWVEPVNVVIGGVALDGGYFPIKYNMDHGGANTKVEAESADDIMARMMAGGYASAYTKDGHLQERVANVKMSLSLDTSTIAKHVTEVIHDLTFSEPVVNAWRILTSAEVSQAFIDADLKAQHQHLKLWVQDSATGHVGASDGMSRAISALRSGFAFSKLALNLKTIMLQPLGLMQSSVVVGKGRMIRHASRMLANPVQISNEVVARSKMMWERRDTFNKDVMDMVAAANRASPAGSKLADFRDDYIIPFGMAGIKATQFYFVDVPTWAAAYEKGLEEFGTEAAAVAYADQTVNRTQGSGIFGDRSGFERGTLSTSVRQSSYVTLMTTLGSYFFAKLNIAIDRTGDLRRGPVTPQAAMSYAMDMLLIYAGEAAVLALISMIGADDDDEENPLASIPVEAGKTFLAGLPVVRDAVGLLDGFQGGTYSSILNAFVKPIQQAKQGEIDKAAVKSVVDLSGMILRLPSTAINRFIDAGSRQANGEDVSPLEYLLGKRGK